MKKMFVDMDTYYLKEKIISIIIIIISFIEYINNVKIYGI